MVRVKHFMSSKIFHGILIPYQGAPKLISLTLKEIEGVLECERTTGYTAEYLDWFGYHITIFGADHSSDKVAARNPLASIITKEWGTIRGNAVILDDNKDLTIEDFRKIIEISKEIPSCTWIPEPEIEAMEKDNTFSIDFIEDITRTSGNQVDRAKIWSKIGKYFILE